MRVRSSHAKLQPHVLLVCSTRQMRVGVDLGGTKIYSVALLDGQVVAETKLKTPAQGGPLGVVDAIVSAVGALDQPGIEAVGIGAPAVVDVDTGVVRRAPNLKGWLEPFPLGPALSDALGGIPVTVDNDVNVGTIAEHRLGAAVGARDVLGIFVGTGVGGGLVLDGQIRRGPHGFAGELGHMVVRPGGRRCGCGGRGHLEAYAGRAGMERHARQLDSRGKDTLLVDLARAQRMTSSVFARALDRGDSVARQLIELAVDTLGWAVAAAVGVLDLPFVVVGGGLADRLGPSFVRQIEKAAKGYLPAYEGGTLQVVPAELGDRGGAIGAALLSEERAGRHPRTRSGQSRLADR